MSKSTIDYNQKLAPLKRQNARADAILVQQRKADPTGRHSRAHVLRQALDIGLERLVEQMHDPNEAL